MLSKWCINDDVVRLSRVLSSVPRKTNVEGKALSHAKLNRFDLWDFRAIQVNKTLLHSCVLAAVVFWAFLALYPSRAC